jgi:hypothetical protein
MSDDETPTVEEITTVAKAGIAGMVNGQCALNKWTRTMSADLMEIAAMHVLAACLAPALKQATPDKQEATLEAVITKVLECVDYHVNLRGHDAWLPPPLMWNLARPSNGG